MGMLLCQCLKTRTDIVKLINFVQDRFESHEYTALSLKNLRWEELQMDWLRSEDLKEKKVVTIPRHSSRLEGDLLAPIYVGSVRTVTSGELFG
jgi:hypothetical protein